jgi:predicted dehydrogenase
LAVVGANVASIDAVGVPVLSTNIDIANARVSFDNGCKANVTASRVSREKIRKIRFFQRDAYVSVDCLKPRVELLRKKEVSEELLLRIASGEVEGGLSDVVDYRVLPIDDREPLRLELESFLHCVEEGVSPPVTGEDGVRALSVALEVLGQISEQVGEPRVVF